MRSGSLGEERDLIFYHPQTMLRKEKNLQKVSYDKQEK